MLKCKEFVINYLNIIPKFIIFLNLEDNCAYCSKNMMLAGLRIRAGDEENGTN